MKTRKKYVMYINPMLGVVFIGGWLFGIRINNATIGTIIDCTFDECVYNLKRLKKRGYEIQKRSY